MSPSHNSLSCWRSKQRLHEVGRRPGVRVADRRAHPAPPAAALDAVLRHQPLDPLVVHPAALLMQRADHPRTAIGAAGAGMDRPDLRDQVGLEPLGVARAGRLAGLPVIEP